MKQRMRSDSGLTVELHDGQRCSFGATEALIGGVGSLLGFGGDILGGLGGLFGVGEAAAAPAEVGLGSIGAAGAGGGAATFADIIGTGTGLAGGATGLEGTLLAGGVPGGLSSVLGLGAGGALGSLGVADSFLGAPAASGFNAGALTPGIDAALPGASAAAPGASAGAPGSVFGNVPTATSGVATVGGSPSTAAIPAVTTGPAGPAAPAAAAAPAGAGSTDLTSSLGGAGSAATTAPTASTAPASASGGSSFLDKIVDSAGKNALPAAIGAGGLAYNVLKGGTGSGTASALPSGAALNTQAGNLAATSPELMGYLTSGTLPAGMKTALDKATQDAKTAAISNAAKSGQPTDPAANSTLSAELAQIDQQQVITTAQLGQQLLQSGLSEASLSASDYSTLLNADQNQQKLISDSISNFAKALGGMGGGINLKVT